MSFAKYGELLPIENYLRKGEYPETIKRQNREGKLQKKMQTELQV